MTQTVNTEYLRVDGKIEVADEIRSGVRKDGKPYKIYRVVVEGFEFESFDDWFSKNIGKTGTFSYKINTYQGKDTKQIYAPKEAKRSSLEQKVDRMLEILERVDERLGKPKTQ